MKNSIFKAHNFMGDFVFRNKCDSISHDGHIFQILARQFEFGAYPFMSFGCGFLDCLDIPLI